MTVISSGCKSFLDIPRTLEYLETEGVCVGTFADGREGPVDFPAFYTRDSGFRSPRVIQNEAEAAAIVCKYDTEMPWTSANMVSRCAVKTSSLVRYSFRQSGPARGLRPKGRDGSRH